MQQHKQINQYEEWNCNIISKTRHIWHKKKLYCRLELSAIVNVDIITFIKGNPVLFSMWLYSTRLPSIYLNSGVHPWKSFFFSQNNAHFAPLKCYSSEPWGSIGRTLPLNSLCDHLVLQVLFLFFSFSRHHHKFCRLEKYTGTNSCNDWQFLLKKHGAAKKVCRNDWFCHIEQSAHLKEITYSVVTNN